MDVRLQLRGWRAINEEREHRMGGGFRDSVWGNEIRRFGEHIEAINFLASSKRIRILFANCLCALAHRAIPLCV